MLRLKYGNTNTYFLQGTCGSILIDTDYAGTMPAFYKELKKNNISKTIMLTGDKKEVGESVAKKLGISRNTLYNRLR